MFVVHLLALVGHSAATAGGTGFYDARSWLVAIAFLGLVVGAGWWLRRPVRRGTRKQRRSARDWDTAELWREHPRADGPKGPDDDEEFLRSLARRYPPA